MFEFDYSWVFGLLPLPLLMRFILPAHHEPRAAVAVPFLARLARLTGQTPQRGMAVVQSSFWRQALVLLSWALVITALARPQWVEAPITKVVPTRDLLLAVDLSGSMEAKDFTDPDGNQIDRLTAAKQVLDEFLARRDGDRVGLIFFGSAAFVQAPFTDDLEVVRTLMDEAQARMAGPQTKMGDAIGLALKVFEESQTRERVLIVLTDGNDTGSYVPPQKAAEIARDKKITIHTVAMGDPQSLGEEKLDAETLQAMSQVTGGRYFHAMDRDQLQEIYSQLDALETRQVETISHRPKRDLFFYPLVVFLVIGLVYHLVCLLKKSTVQTGSTAVERSRSYGGLLVLCLLAAAVGILFAWPMGSTRPLHFIRSWCLTGLVPVGLLVWFIKHRQEHHRPWQGFVSEHLLKFLLVGQDQARRLRPWHLLALVWGVTVVAISGPTWQQEPAPFAEDKAALFLIVKVTPSMQARDIQPSRLERAVHKIGDLLALRKGSLNGLIAYSGSAHLVMPLTRDETIIKTFATALAPEIMPAEGDVLAEALALAEERLERAALPGSILVLTDAIPQAQQKALAEMSREPGVAAHILALAGPTASGNPPAPALDPDGLQQMAALLGGSLTVVTADTTDVDRIASRLENDLQASDLHQEGRRWRDFGYWLVPLMAILSVMWFRPGWLVRYE